MHLKLAHAAVDGTRWAAARRQLGIAGDLLAADPQASLAAETTVLNAEVAFTDNDIDRARALAKSALASPQASPQVRCHAHELLGRVLRGNDLDAARDAFEQALATAEAAGLAVWRLRALHQLGTIDMFDDARADRLSQARRIADELGAASTGAVIDLQLTACAMFRYELGEAEHHAQSAVTVSTRLGLAKTHAIGLLFLAEVQALRRDRVGMGRFGISKPAPVPGVSLYERAAYFCRLCTGKRTFESPGGNVNLRDLAGQVRWEGEEWLQGQPDRIQVKADKRQNGVRWGAWRLPGEKRCRGPWTAGA